MRDVQLLKLKAVPGQRERLDMAEVSNRHGELFSLVVLIPLPLWHFVKLLKRFLSCWRCFVISDPSLDKSLTGLSGEVRHDCRHRLHEHVDKCVAMLMLFCDFVSLQRYITVG